jgi:hypothetical protein
LATRQVAPDEIRLISQTLRLDGPPGSSEQILIDFLKEEGFGSPAQCDSDHSIKVSEFRLNGNEVVAQAYWKADLNGTLVWTRGFVA